MLIASKCGTISAGTLIRESGTHWVLSVEKSEVLVSKTKGADRAFNNMVDALKWAEADQELVDHFTSLMAARASGGK
ncbi:hypothetical protein [Pseudomonas violetae]|uniref:Uncharacterized protein n=1 Tax=Pseudomonas violetae TaxID=2915813 RepID=A0ABT0ETK4_9PSED|nr:hypothetical protein [Pseudomonas violetae]MCK1788817.1 hypothetical protein [Pseudomonas violetae]